MHKPISNCPICDGRVEPVKLKCISCEMAMEGRFPISKLGLLPADQQQFVEAFLVARGNIKAVERELGISYPRCEKSWMRSLTRWDMPLTLSGRNSLKSLRQSSMARCLRRKASQP